MGSGFVIIPERGMGRFCVPSYYYIDLMFDSDLGEVVEATINGLLKSGCRYKRASMRVDGEPGAVSLSGREINVDLGSIKGLAQAYVDEQRRRGRRIIPFPPWDRIVFEYDFRFDYGLLDEVEHEEAESNSCARDIGLSFVCDEGADVGGRVKASICFWEEFILLYGSDDTHRANMTMILGMVENIYNASGPFFGAMNGEMYLNTDKSMKRLLEGEFPVGEEFVVLGKKMLERVDVDKLRGSGYELRGLPDGGMLVQFRKRWG
jgi:hypothetical protein